jgi:hypothetical protein
VNGFQASAQTQEQYALADYEEASEECPECLGDGWINLTAERDGREIDFDVKCKRCRGGGLIGFGE